MADFEIHAVEDSQGWRARPFMLAGIGILAAVLAQQLIHRSDGYFWSPVTLPAWRVALAIGIASSAAAIGFSLERVRIGWAIGFAAAIGLVAGLVFFWNGEPGWGFFSDWRSASLVLALAIFVPLFQTARDEGAARFPYVEVHGHAWTNVVLWCACWGFTGTVFALVMLLAALFDLIGLHFLRDLLNHDWFDAALFGAAFGGALGLFRESDRVVRLLQRVVTAVLGVLAPVLGLGLLVFLGSLPFTGLGSLWEATRATTPILLGCVIGALILANAVIGNGADEELHNPVLRWGALALALSVLPLAVIAAIATGLRIGQYGLTPDRLWALTFVILACVYGLAYFVSLVRGRRDWADRVRPANLRMAFVVAGFALFLATPLLSFNALSTRDQVARLESGRIAPDKFDWAALAFDCGDPGKVALKRLTASRNAMIARLAADTATKKSRYQMIDTLPNQRALATLSKRMRILPQTTAVPEGLRILLADYGACGREPTNRCTMLYRPEATEAIIVPHLCVENVSAEPKTVSADAAGAQDTVMMGNPSSHCAVARFRLIAGKWQAARAVPLDAAGRAGLRTGLAGGGIEVRPVARRQVFVGGVPVGEPFE